MRDRLLGNFLGERFGRGFGDAPVGEIQIVGGQGEVSWVGKAADRLARSHRGDDRLIDKAFSFHESQFRIVVGAVDG
jgi:hypothetical protein